MPDSRRLNVSKFIYRIIAVLSILHIPFHMFAQLNTTSPYSRYGVGEFKQPGFAQNFSMGGIGTAMQSDTITPYNTNLANPASLPYMRLTTFEAGLMSNTSMLSTATQSQTTNATSFGYLSLAFPIKKWWGAALSLSPMTGIGYNVAEAKNLDSVGSVNYNYHGSGGINKVSFSNGFKIKGLSFGLNASYLFGRMDQSKTVGMPYGNGYYSTEMDSRINVSDFYFDYGIQYGFTVDSIVKNHKRQALHDPIRIIVGATYSPMATIGVTSNLVSENYFFSTSGYNTYRDTIENIQAQKNTIKLPSMFSVGVSVHKGDKLTIGAEYAMQNWSTFEMLGANGGLSNSTRFSVGAQYTLIHKSDLNVPNTFYMKKVYYRLGFRYNTLPVNIYGTQINESAVSLGFGLPVGANRHMWAYNVVNLGLEFGQRGTTSNNLVKEQFFNLVVGITLNDKWFNKVKFD